MAGTRNSTFYWPDWLSDNNLALCSRQARGTWMGLLCIAAMSPKPGFVMLKANQKPTTAQLIIACRVQCSEEEFEADVQELIDNGVCDVSREGIIVSRRLVRDEKKRSGSSKGGKIRQAQITETQDKNGVRTRWGAQVPPSGDPGVPSQESTPIPSPTPINGGQNGVVNGGNVVPIESRYSEAEQLCRALGFSLTDDVRRQNWPAKLLTLKNEGIPFDALLEAAKARREAGLVPVDVYSPVFLKQDALAILRKRERLAASQPPTPQASMFTRDEWISRVRLFLRVGCWGPEWGPMPIEDGFLGDDDIAEKACAKWELQRNAPEIVHVGNHDEGYFEVYADPRRHRNLPPNMQNPIPVTRTRRKIG